MQCLLFKLQQFLFIKERFFLNVAFVLQNLQQHFVKECWHMTFQTFFQIEYESYNISNDKNFYLHEQIAKQTLFYEMLTHDFSNISPNDILQLQYLQWWKFLPSEEIARVLISFEATCVHKEKTSFKCCICHTEFQQFVSIKERII